MPGFVKEPRYVIPWGDDDEMDIRSLKYALVRRSGGGMTQAVVVGVHSRTGYWELEVHVDGGRMKDIRLGPDGDGSAQLEGASVSVENVNRWWGQVGDGKVPYVSLV